MKLLPYKNKYDHEIVDCPFCTYSAHIRPISKTSPDPTRDLKRHITSASKNEALMFFLSESSVIPHLTYYRDHTSDEKTVKIKKRNYDNDLSI